MKRIATSLAGAAALSLMITGCGSSGNDATASGNDATAKSATPAATRNVGVTLKEFTLTPRPTTARSGQVTFTVRNVGKLKHEFVVLRTRKPASKLLKGDEASEAGNVGEIGNVPPGASRTLRLMLKPGHYALICNLPGHYKAGQYANLNVK